MREDILQGLVASDLAHNVANDAAEKGLQRLQRSPRPFELFGVRVALLLDERELADARIGLAQAHAMLFGKPHEALSGAMHQLGVCGEGDRLLLHGRIDDHLGEVRWLRRAGSRSDRKALLQ